MEFHATKNSSLFDQISLTKCSVIDWFCKFYSAFLFRPTASQSLPAFSLSHSHNSFLFFHKADVIKKIVDGLKGCFYASKYDIFSFAAPSQRPTFQFMIHYLLTVLFEFLGFLSKRPKYLQWVLQTLHQMNYHDAKYCRNFS